MQNKKNNKELLHKLYEKGKYREIIELTGYKIKFDKKFILTETLKKITVTLSCIYVNIYDDTKSGRYCSKLIINSDERELYSGSEIMKLLKDDIIKYVIKKEL